LRRGDGLQQPAVEELDPGRGPDLWVVGEQVPEPG
jgi:hypothetical protein